MGRQRQQAKADREGEGIGNTADRAVLALDAGVRSIRILQRNFFDAECGADLGEPGIARCRRMNHRRQHGLHDQCKKGYPYPSLQSALCLSSHYVKITTSVRCVVGIEGKKHGLSPISSRKRREQFSMKHIYRRHGLCSPVDGCFFADDPHIGSGGKSMRYRCGCGSATRSGLCVMFLAVCTFPGCKCWISTELSVCGNHVLLVDDETNIFSEKHGKLHLMHCSMKHLSAESSDTGTT